MAMCHLLEGPGKPNPARVFRRMQACIHACTIITIRICGYSVYGIPVHVFIFPAHRLNCTWPYKY